MDIDLEKREHFSEIMEVALYFVVIAFDFLISPPRVYEIHFNQLLVGKYGGMITIHF